MSDLLWQTLRLSFELAAVTTLILLVIGIPLAWWLVRWRNAFKPLVEAAIALPLILPPTVLGFYLLLLMSPTGALGKLWAILFGTPLTFTFEALVIGSCIYSLPFVVQPLQGAMQQLDDKLLEAAALIGASPKDRFFTIVLPLIRFPILIAACMGFAHTLGEFGVVLMIGGGIPGETQVISIALYDQVEQLKYQSAHQMALILIAVSLTILAALFALQRRKETDHRL